MQSFILLLVTLHPHLSSHVMGKMGQKDWGGGGSQKISFFSIIDYSVVQMEKKTHMYVSNSKIIHCEQMPNGNRSKLDETSEYINAYVGSHKLFLYCCVLYQTIGHIIRIMSICVNVICS